MHQLRGRIGRGTAQVVLRADDGREGFAGSGGATGRDGAHAERFEIAELDLQQRGPGEFFGTQAGRHAEFPRGQFARDREILELARSEARLVLEGPNEQISKEEIANAVTHLRAHWNRRYGLVEVG